MLITKANASSLRRLDRALARMRTRSSANMAGSGCVLAALLFNCLLIAGCVPQADLGDSFDGHRIKAIEIENVRFELQELSYPIQPALAYWLRRSDKVAPRWDTFEFQFEREGAMCQFLDNTSAGDCQICDACTNPSAVGPPCFGISPMFDAEVIQVVADAGFIRTENPQVILTYEGDAGKVLGTCASNIASVPTPLFPAETSGLYRLRSGGPIKPTTDGEIKLHTVEPNQTPAVPYQLIHQEIGTTHFWTWTVQGETPWMENFSPNLRVSKIRILKGTCANDPVNGRKCAVPGEAQVVKPSRILFMPNFTDFSGSEANYVCHDDANAAEGYYISLSQCRTTNDMNPTIEEKPATPTYLKFGGENNGPNPLEPITWLVEFNTNEGGDAMPADAVLIIEFVIEGLAR